MPMATVIAPTITRVEAQLCSSSAFSSGFGFSVGFSLGFSVIYLLSVSLGVN